jgi:hypothetical protein
MSKSKNVTCFQCGAVIRQDEVNKLEWYKITSFGRDRRTLLPNPDTQWYCCLGHLLQSRGEHWEDLVGTVILDDDTSPTFATDPWRHGGEFRASKN